MHTTLDSKGNKKTIANKSDVSKLRAAREMANHCASNVPELSEAGKQAAAAIGSMVTHFDPPAANPPAVAGSTAKAG